MSTVRGGVAVLQRSRSEGESPVNCIGPEIDIWRVANLMLKHGEDTDLESARRAFTLGVGGDGVIATRQCGAGSQKRSASSGKRPLLDPCIDLGDAIVLADPLP